MNRKTAINSQSQDQAGLTLIEIMAAVVVLTIGLLAVAKMFPNVSRSQVRNDQYQAANFIMAQTNEQLLAADEADPSLTVGRHPAAGFDSLGPTRKLLRSYNVSVLPAPLDKVKRVVVGVQWTTGGRTLSITDTLYVRK